MKAEPAESPIPARESAVRATPGGRQLVRNTLAQLLAPAFRVILGIVLTAALSRYLGVQGLGAYSLVFAYVGIFNGIFNEWGLSTVLLRNISQHSERGPRIMAAGLALQSLVSTASFAVPIAVLPLLGYPLEVKVAAAAYGATLLLGPLNLLVLPLTAGQILDRTVRPSIFGVALNFLLLMAVIVAHGSILALAAAAAFALLAQTVWVSLLGWQILGSLSRFNLNDLRRLAWDAWPIGGAVTLKVVWQQGPLLLLAAVSLREVGLFSAASRAPMLLLVLPVAVTTTFFPSLARLWTVDRAGFATLLDRLLRGGLLAVAPMSVLAIGLAPAVVSILYGPNFAPAALPFAIWIGILALMFPIVLLTEALNAVGRQVANLIFHAVGLCVAAPLLLVLAPRSGAAGASFALLGGYLFFLIIVSAYAHRALGLRSPLTLLLVPCTAAVAGLCVSWLAVKAGIYVGSLAGAVVAAIVMLGLWRGQMRDISVLWAAVRGRRST